MRRFGGACTILHTYNVTSSTLKALVIAGNQNTTDWSEFEAE
jgi:hypothetical protein